MRWGTSTTAPRHARCWTPLPRAGPSSTRWRCTPNLWRSSPSPNACRQIGWRSSTTRPARLPSRRATARTPLSDAGHVLGHGSTASLETSVRPGRIQGKRGRRRVTWGLLPRTPRGLDKSERQHRRHHLDPGLGGRGRQVRRRARRGRPPHCPQLSRHGAEGRGRRASAPCPVPPSFVGGTSDHALEALPRIKNDVPLWRLRNSTCRVVHVCTLRHKRAGRDAVRRPPAGGTGRVCRVRPARCLPVLWAGRRITRSKRFLASKKTFRSSVCAIAPVEAVLRIWLCSKAG